MSQPFFQQFPYNFSLSQISGPYIYITRKCIINDNPSSQRNASDK